MCPLFGLLEEVAGAPADDLHTVVLVGQEEFLQVQGLGAAIHQGDHYDAEAVLELGEFVKLVQDHALVFSLLQLHHHAAAFPVTLVPHVGHPGNLVLFHQFRNAGDYVVSVALVWDFREYYLFPARLDSLHVGPRPDSDGAPARRVSLQNAPGPADEAPRGEIRSFYYGEDLLYRGLGVINNLEDTVAYLVCVMRGYAGGHSHGNPRGAVTEEAGEPCGQDGGF